jgi:hypothetical protein
MKSGEYLPPKLRSKKADAQDLKERQRKLASPPSSQSRVRYAGTSRPQK